MLVTAVAASVLAVQDLQSREYRPRKDLPASPRSNMACTFLIAKGRRFLIWRCAALRVREQEVLPRTFRWVQSGEGVSEVRPDALVALAGERRWLLCRFIRTSSNDLLTRIWIVVGLMLKGEWFGDVETQRGDTPWIR